VIEDSFYFADT